jgi:hypothetical protein
VKELRVEITLFLGLGLSCAHFESGDAGGIGELIVESTGVQRGR